jgi:hypothetical protein
VRGEKFPIVIIVDNTSNVPVKEIHVYLAQLETTLVDHGYDKRV